MYIPYSPKEHPLTKQAHSLFGRLVRCSTHGRSFARLWCVHTSVYAYYIHSYICTFIHAYMHTYIHTYIHAHIHTYIQYIHAYIHTYIYCSLVKQHPWMEHLTSLPKRGVGTLLSVSTFNHKRAPMSCLQRLNVLKANNWTNNNIQRNHQQPQSQVLTAHNTLNGTMSPWAWCTLRRTPH